MLKRQSKENRLVNGSAHLNTKFRENLQEVRTLLRE